MSKYEIVTFQGKDEICTQIIQNAKLLLLFFLIVVKGDSTPRSKLPIRRRISLSHMTLNFYKIRLEAVGAQNFCFDGLSINPQTGWTRARFV